MRSRSCVHPRWLNETSCASTLGSFPVPGPCLLLLPGTFAYLRVDIPYEFAAI